MTRDTVTIGAIPLIIQMETGGILNILLVVAIIVIVTLMELADQTTTRCIMAILKTMASNKNKL